MSKMISPLQQVRSEYAPKLPPALRDGANVKVEKGAPLAAFADAEKIAALFPSTSNMPDLKFKSFVFKPSAQPLSRIFLPIPNINPKWKLTSTILRKNVSTSP